MRDYLKQAEHGRQIIQKHMGYDMSVNEWIAIVDSAKEKDIFTVIHDAWLFGVAVGSRITKKNP